MKPYYSKKKQFIISCLLIIAGNLLLAFLVAAFIIPHDIVMGGTTGIGIALHRVLPWLDVSIFVLALNVILLIIGLFILGKHFFFTTVASSILYPVFLGFFQRIPGIDSLTDNALLASIFAGALMGIALGMVMRAGSSTGGMDVVDLILHKWTHLPIALFVYLGDAVVIGFQAFSLPAEKTLLGILVLVLETILLDRAMILGKARIQLMVISDRCDEIREAILNRLSAGATQFFIETGRLKKQEKAVVSVISERKVYEATEIIHGIDPAAFITISKINEVRGRGFTLERTVLEEVDAPDSEGEPVVPADGERQQIDAGNPGSK